MRIFLPVLMMACLGASCVKKTVKPPAGTTHPGVFDFSNITVDGAAEGLIYYNVGFNPYIRIAFTAPVAAGNYSGAIGMISATGANIPLNVSLANGDSLLEIKPLGVLSPISSYTLTVTTDLKSKDAVPLLGKVVLRLVTSLDTSDKFPRISDSALLDLVEQQTFHYFWDFADPASGMARERNTSGDICATGGTGFGVMAILVGIKRNFITRNQGLDRIRQLVSFLKNSCTRYHGAFAHWINGSTGATVPFSSQDDGGDLVETSYLMEGLLCARQYFNHTLDSTETGLRQDIDSLWDGVDWNWYRQNGQNTLFWHWSPDFGWSTNMQINGWNEALITYVLAASSNTDSIPRSVYDNGWALNGSLRNGRNYLGVTLPLGPDYGGPLFFSQYSFLGLDPLGLSDAYANYWTQDTAQAQINYRYCLLNPLHYNAYGDSCWGLTASDDDISGYSAHSPTNDLGVISPTAALSSLPYTPQASMDALRFFYYKLGDKIWGPYGFTDAFNLSEAWFATSYLAIDQGPEIDMIENYRSGMLWNLFMSCPEVQRGLSRLGFQSPFLP